MAFQRKKPAAIGIKAAFPGFIEPALATLEKVPTGDRCEINTPLRHRTFLPSRPSDMVSVVVSELSLATIWSMLLLQRGQLAHSGNFSITAASNAPIAPGIRVGIGLGGYTNNPTPVIYTPQTGSALNVA